MTRRLAGRQRGDEILNDRHAGLLPAFAGAINCINLAVELVQRFLSCPIRQAVVRRDMLRVLGTSRSIRTRTREKEFRPAFSAGCVPKSLCGIGP